jgi:hypothetical protein
MIIFLHRIPEHADQSGAFDHLALSLGRHDRAQLSMMLAGRTFELRAQAVPQMTQPSQCRSQTAPQHFATGRIGKRQSRVWGTPRNTLQAKGDPA